MTASVVPAVLLEGVYAAYDRHAALEDVSFRVPEGSFAALIGPNGAGKSTCLRLLLGLLRPRAGRVEVFGQAPERRDRHGRPIGYVPQKVVIPRGFPITVLDVVVMGRTAILGPGRFPAARDHDLARSALEQVDLGDVWRRRFQDLSGGQQQRALIARALCAEPRLLLLDEPTAGLDTSARARFYALVCELQAARGLTLLCATHDLDVVGDHADTLILLDRRIRAQGPPRDVLESAEMRSVYPFPTPHVHAKGVEGE